MSALRSLARALSRVIDAFLTILCVLFVLLGLYAFADNAYLYGNATDASVLRYKPEAEMALCEERKISENQVAWICIPGSGVDYPVLQGEDNAEYLNKDPYGEFSYSGSIFLDHRNAPDFSDGLSVLYGHHMSNG